MRSERARDHVLGNVCGNFGFWDLAGRSHLPHQAVIKRQLLQQVSAEPIDAAIADVCHQGALRQQHQATARGAHALKTNAALAFRVNNSICIANGLPQRGRRIEIAQLEVHMGDIVDG